MQSEKTIQASTRIVSFDMDGVIIDHTANKLSLAKKYGIDLRPEETHSEMIRQYFEENSYAELQNELYSNSRLALSAPLFAGVRDSLLALRARDISFLIISRRRNHDIAIQLLTEKGLWGDLFNPTNTFFVNTPEEKNAVAAQQKVTHHVDDERRVLSVMPYVQSRILFDAFGQFKDEREFARVPDWNTLTTLLLSI